MARLIESADEPAWREIAPLVELGVQHEQQHQELILMDIKHVFSVNPLLPAYQAPRPAGARRRRRRSAGSSLPAGSTRSATRAAVSPSTTRRRGTRSGSSPSASPTGR